MKPTEPKAVKAWAVVTREGRIIAVQLEERRAEFIAHADERVIPVTIVPGHEAEDD